MPKYYLSAHVRACVADGTTILLDMKSDRYIGLGPAEASALQSRVENWPAAERCDLPFETRAAEELIYEFLERGLLTPDQTEPFAMRTAPCRPMRQVIERGAAAIGLRNVLRFSAATLKAWTMIRVRSLHQIVTAVTSRKALFAQRTPASTSQVVELASAFTDLRPWFYTGQSACLFDSLVLIEFLAAHAIYPTWIFGVHATPFSAHSWVQHEDFVLNDTAEAVSHYTPILVI
jgi:transglutaminase superfamily protein